MFTSRRLQHLVLMNEAEVLHCWDEALLFVAENQDPQSVGKAVQTLSSTIPSTFAPKGNRRAACATTALRTSPGVVSSDQRFAACGAQETHMKLSANFGESK